MKNNILTPKYKNGIFLRQIRSFVCRTGRITQSQLYAIKKYWTLYGVDFQLHPLNFDSLFNRCAPVVLDIGFGSGESLVHAATSFPDKNFLGVEVYKSGIGSCLNLSQASGVQNLKIIYHDAIEVFNTMISDDTLSFVQFFFPDPWRKKRHHKRRILQNYVLKIILKKLVTEGILHIITDVEEYAFYVLNEIKNIDNYINISHQNNFILKPLSPISTKFEIKGLLRGHTIFNLIFKKK